MSLNFPASPSLNQQSTQNGRVYQWDGYAWSLVNAVVGHASTHASGGSDPVTIQTSQISDLAAGANAAVRMYLWANFR